MLLRQVADRLRMNLRDDDSPARLGGDEFAVLLPRTEVTEALAIATRIGATLRCEYDLGVFGPASIDASIGVACAPDHADAADTLMSHADSALYAAKAHGRNQTGPEGPNDGLGALRTAASMVGDLRAALQSGRLHLAYQPVCHCATTEVIAYEALLGWNDPIRGNVPPAEFIPAAEGSGFIVPLSDWVLRRACADAAGWGSPAQVSVNLSPLNFSQPDLVATITSILGKTGLPPDRLIIEVTEGLLLDRSLVVQGTMQGLRALGIELWLDDFGTGYANFATLRSTPFSSIKIDRSFLAAGPDGATILGAMISFGKVCGFKVIVEGVKTAEQLDLLRTLGCDCIQGHLLGVPAKAKGLPGYPLPHG